ncbi:MAG: C-terminal binding protein [Nitrososphaeria archaeon]|nr:C-terminal binding protein [Nitrososphaeria archaeon]
MIKLDKKVFIAITDSDYPDFKIEAEVLEKIGARVERYHSKTDDDVVKFAKDADALLNQYAPITEKVFQSLDKLKIVVRYGVGVDNIDIEAATRAGVLVCNVIYDITDVADHTMALLLASWRRLKNLDNFVFEGKWDWKLLGPLPRFSGSTVGIIGYGKIGKLVAKRLKGFDVKVLVYDPYVRDDDIVKDGFVPKRFEELLKESDAITLHVPLTRETYHLLNEKSLSMMKDGVIVINTCRGKVIDTKALVNAIKSGKILYAGLDVLEEEPPSKGLLEELKRCENVILTPHTAWYSNSSLHEVRFKAALQVVQLFEGKVPEYLVNKSVLERARCKSMLKT